MTEFEFKLHPVGTRAVSVELDFPVDRALDELKAWRDLSATAPRQATFAATMMNGTVTLGYVWVGDPAAGLEYANAFKAALGAPTPSGWTS